MPSIEGVGDTPYVPVPNPERSEEREHWNRYVLKELAAHQPPYSECVHFGKRRLSWLAWLPGLSNNSGSLIDRENLEVSHEHLRFEQSGHNVGFGPKGLFGEDMGKYRYRFGSTCFDGSKIRRAMTELAELGPYHFIKNNCQDFVSKVRSGYRALSR